MPSKASLEANYQLFSHCPGLNSWENLIAMGLKYEQHGEYHRDKGAKIEVGLAAPGTPSRKTLTGDKEY